MSFRYAAFTVMTPEHTPQEAARMLKDIGYAGVEWRVHNSPKGNGTPADMWRSNKATLEIDTIAARAAEYRMITDDLGLEVVGLGTYLGYTMIDEIARCMEAARIMGCDSIRVSTPKYDGSKDYNDLLEQAYQGFYEIADLASQFKVRAVIELHEGNICCSASTAYRLVGNFDPDHIGVILDPANMVCEGYEGWQMGLEMLGPYLAYVHVKNAKYIPSGETKGARKWSTEHVPINEGIVVWPDVIEALQSVGYAGWLCLEDLSRRDVEAKLTEGLSLLQSWDNEPTE